MSTETQKVDVLAVIRSEIERAGGEAFPVGRALIATHAAVAELIEAMHAVDATFQPTEGHLGVGRYSFPANGATAEKLRNALARVGGAK